MVLRKADAYAYDSYYASLADQQLAVTYSELMLVEPVLKATSNLVGFLVNPGAITIRTEPDSQFIEVIVEDVDPGATALIANTLVKSFIDYSESLQVGRFEESERTIDSQIEEIEYSLVDVENKLTALLSASIDQQEAHVQSLIDEASRTITEIEQDIATLESANPSESVQSSLSTQRVNLQIWQSSLDIYLQLYIGLVVRGEGQFSDSLRIQIDQLRADQSLYQDLYADLVSSRESVRLAKLEATPNIVQIEPAEMPLYPIGQRPTWILGGVLAAMAVIGYIYLLMMLDNTVKSPENAERLLGVPVLGIMMDDSQVRSDPPETPIVVRMPRSPISEGVRKIRANLNFTHVDEPLRSMMVTSTEEGEGKSTLAVNLACAVAQSGKRVLLIDSDMRRPTVHKKLAISGRVGLSDLLSRAVTQPEAIQPTCIPELSAIASGPLPPNPSELLGSQLFANLIGEFQEQYDLVIIDSPPAMLADPTVISKVVDGTLYCIRPGHTNRNSTLAAVNELRRNSAHILGTVLTRTEQFVTQYYAYNQYYTNYGYGYFDDEAVENGRFEKLVKPVRSYMQRNRSVSIEPGSLD